MLNFADAKNKNFIFCCAEKVEIRETILPPLKDDEVLVETVCSAISAGTEMLVYRNQFPHLIDVHDSVSSDLNYPLAYGYACVGKVRELGKMVNGEWKERFVFSFQSHTSHFITKTESLFPIPNSLTPETACLFPNMETAVNLIQDGAPILGERVLVLGQGVIGLLTASLLNEFPLERLIVVDNYELRRNALQVESFSSNNLYKDSFAYAQENFDLTYELTGSPTALNDAIELTMFNGRIVIGSWYGQKQEAINLGGSFHRSRIKLISSQVSTISPELSGRWDKARRFQITWEALERIKPEKWITHRFSLDDASKAYQLLDENPQETIQVIFNF
ncbi:MAG: zinc-binding alcohol dehydrogenase [Anaerolineales bacterium]|nr:zinc-binding alcohol dehydrogenase [Anaerolineales bacterium]